ncbi:MFS transporter, partial [Candidatus Bathyarchaeota archaeon]|nr:MFS transporter [Candidatus Bathyarchaeota archaeon]
MSRRGLTRDVVLLSLAIFFTDASHSTVIPIFPGYAKEVGASLSVLGSYGSMAAVAMLLLSIPLGRLSDRYGRKRLMVPGLALFIVVPLGYIAATSPLHLYPIRVALGLGVGLIFGNGFLLMTEVAEPGFRNVAQGMYMTSMGLGFTLGPLVGGFAAKLYGSALSFRISSGFAVLGLLLLLFVTERGVEVRGVSEAQAGLGELLRDPRVIASGVANFVNSVMFNAVALFFPVYGADIGLDEADVGIGLTSRGLASTAVRLPVGSVMGRFGALNLMAAGLLLSAATLFSVSGTTGLILVSALMGVQGLAYGVYLTSGSVYVSEEAPSGERGTVMAVYSTFGNLGGIIGPTVLGLIAERVGAAGALRFSAAVAVIGVALVLALARRGASSPDLAS